MTEANSNGTATLQAKLNDPNTLAALTRLLDRIDTLEQTVNTLASAMEQGPGMMAFVTDTVDDTVREAQFRGIDIDERLRNGLAIAEKLTEPRTVEVLSGLLERIDQLEKLVDMADQAPDMMDIVTDTVDESVRDAYASGIDVEERLRGGLELAEKLTEPDTVAVLSKLVERADVLEQALHMADQAPGMVAFVADTVDDTMRQAYASGIDVEQRMQASLDLLVKASDPKTMQVLSSMLDRVDRLEPLLEMADQAPGLVAVAIDSLDDAYASLARAGFDVERIIGQSISAAGKVSMILDSDEFTALMESGALDPKTVAIVGSAGQAMSESQATAQPVGFMGMLRAMRDSDTQRALGFMMSFAKRFGQLLNQ